MSATNFIDGVNNVNAESTLGQFVLPDPTSVHMFFNDFDKYNVPVATTPAVPGDFVLSGATPGTVAVTSADGGVITLTNDNTDAHSTFAQWSGATGTVLGTFAFDPARSFWMKARFKISEATINSFMLGLAAVDTTPLDDANGLFWIKAAASTTLQFKAVNSSTATTVNVGTMADNTYTTVGLWYSSTLSGDGIMRTYFNDAPSGTVDLTNVPGTSTNLALTLGVLNGTSQVTGAVLSVDYFMAAKRRTANG
jgi:hypothetical protein